MDADGCGRAMRAEKCADGCGVGAREWLEMGGEKKPLVMSELGCADGCGRQMGGGGVGAGRLLVMTSLATRTAAENGCGEVRGWPDGVGATEWLEMGIRSRW